jgi:tryptophan halogenase
MSIPDTLEEKIALFRVNGQIFREEDELFTETSWAAVMMGQGIQMEGHSPMADRLGGDEFRHEIDGIEKSIRHLVGHMPSHAQFLASYCPAKELPKAVPRPAGAGPASPLAAAGQ